MADFADRLKSNYLKRAEAEINQELEKYGLKLDLNANNNNSDEPQLVKNVRAELERILGARVAKIEREEIQNVLKALSDIMPGSELRATPTNITSPTTKSTLQPAKPAKTTAPNKAPKAAALSFPRRAEPAATTKPKPSTKQALPVESGSSFNIGADGNLKIRDVAAEVGYAITDTVTHKVAEAHFNSQLTRIIGAIGGLNGDDIRSVSTRITSRRAYLKLAGEETTDVATIPEASNNRLVHTLGSIIFELGGVAVIRATPTENALTALKTNLLHPNKCTALVYPTADGKFQVELAAPTDLAPLRAKLAKQAANS